MIVPEVEDLASSVLAVEMTAAKERQKLRAEHASAPTARGKKK